MVPLKLFIKNFLSYGNTTQCIDFSPYQLICLSGKNGHGKSALLDAITWTVWGHARKIQTATRADEGLMRLGQSQMVTSLDIQCKGTVYRIRREYANHQGKAQQSLDFGIVDPATQQVKSLNEKTVRGTQEKIISVIGLDYDGFINSVFLRQGASNEFSKKSPKERKEILCSMLGINHFEHIKKRAQEKSRTLTTQHDLFVTTQKRLAHEIQESVLLPEQLATLQQTERELLDQHTRKQTAHAGLLVQVQAYQAQQHVYASLTEQLKQVQAQQVKYTADLRQERAAWKHIVKRKQAQSRQPHDIEQTRVAIEQELAQLALAEELEHKKIVAYEKEKAQLHALYQSRTEQASRLLATREKILNDYEREKKTLEQQRQNFLNPATFERYKDAYHRLVATKNQLHTQSEDHRHKQTLLNASSAGCPTCQKQLNGQEKERLLESLAKQHTHSMHQIKRLTQLLPALKQKLVAAHELLAVHERAVQLEQQLAPCEREYLEAVRERDALRAQLTELEKTVIQPRDTQRKKELEAQRDSILSTSGDAQTLKTVCEQAFRMVRSRIEQLRDVKNTHKQLLTHYKSLTEVIGQSQHIVSEEAQLKTDLTSLQARLHELYLQKGTLEEKLKQKTAQEVELKQLELKIGEIEQQAQQYTIIGQALSKDGLQALLIEQAIPEIEQEANLLLEKLTENQAHLSIESLRDLKSGKSKETLDIHISDSSGIRAYELFSGGEAFRIDFALRIALSKLLARRAGTSLQTLIIDEGFGSQDEEGLSHMLDALYKIQDDFAKIIIVSHLPFMKDHFPVHFVVHKSANGSSVKVIEQG